jgi:hypothetical protein
MQPKLSLNLSTAIKDSLHLGHLVPNFSDCLFAESAHTTLRHRNETTYWDYKETQDLKSDMAVARLARDILGFHNTDGGAIIIGVSDDFRIMGVSPSQTLDTKRLRDLLGKFIGTDVPVFQESLPLRNGRLLWLILIPSVPDGGMPVAAKRNGPLIKDRYELQRNQYYLRDGDSIKAVVEPSDLEELIRRGRSAELYAYSYELDEPSFRLLAPDFEHFFGREELLRDLYDEVLGGRNPVIALEGMGGVGKTAAAIRLVRILYDARKLQFVVSLSAKTRVWRDAVASRKPAFSGYGEFLLETAKVLGVPPNSDLEQLKLDIYAMIEGYPGIFLADNLEDVQSDELLTFLRKVPEPVKVLVTSRLDRERLGAVVFPVEALTDHDARLLFAAELERHGHHHYRDETDAFSEIIDIAGGIPLYLKWGANLAVEYTTLREAARQLRSRNIKKGDFLQFTLQTMWDFTQNIPRHVAMLSASLGSHWNAELVALALNLDVRHVYESVSEFRKKGLVLASSKSAPGVPGEFRLLPMTADFLVAQWHENGALRREVTERLLSMVPETGGDLNRLMTWPRSRSIEVLTANARLLLDNGNAVGARQIVQVARSITTAASVQFLAGRVEFALGERQAAYDLMELSVNADSATVDRVFYANALLERGSGGDERSALRLLETALTESAGIDDRVVETYFRVANELGDYASMARVLETFKTPDSCYKALERVFTLMKNIAFLSVAALPLRDAIEQALTSTLVNDNGRRLLENTRKKVEAGLNRIGISGVSKS